MAEDIEPDEEKEASESKAKEPPQAECPRCGELGPEETNCRNCRTWIPLNMSKIRPRHFRRTHRTRG